MQYLLYILVDYALLVSCIDYTSGFFHLTGRYLESEILGYDHWLGMLKEKINVSQHECTGIGIERSNKLHLKNTQNLDKEPSPLHVVFI